MIEIKPFQALVYNRERIRDLRQVVTPPYDIISQADQERYYQINPYNIVRLVLGKEYTNDNEFKNKYQRAANYLDGWIKEGVLKRFPQPAIYVYAFNYQLNGKEKQALGIVPLVRLAEFKNGTILPHEKTFSGPKADRLKLMQACQANLDQVYAIYSDASGKIRQLLAGESLKEPLIMVTDEANILHRIWAITDRLIIKQLSDCLADKALYIADGHHRYETALNYSRWRKHQDAEPDKDATYNYIPMLIIDIDHEELAILPTHRLIADLGRLSKPDFLNRLEKLFKVQALETPAKMFLEMKRYNNHIFGLYFNKNNNYLLILKDGNLIEKYLPASASEDWKKLDTAILQHLILENILEIRNQDQGKPANLSFVENQNEALAAVDKNEAAAAIFLNPPKLDQIKQIALNGETMPQKSTYFYPKPLTGLILNTFT